MHRAGALLAIAGLMELFKCECGAAIFFDNARCLSCQQELGYVPEHGRLVRLDAATSRAEVLGASFVKCRNYEQEGVCNWLVSELEAQGGQPYCRACRLNEMIPDLSEPANRVYWARIEAAKRRLVYTLLWLGLPLRDRRDDAERGLGFRFLADPPAEDKDAPRHLTGHDSGIITLNIREADAVEREQIRQQLAERYRTLLGHFRHESGHFYWDELVQDSPSELERFRELFGDERADYAEALAAHYERGPALDWQERHVSAYAASHPWEDFAETWAHYLHLADSLQTGRSFGVKQTEAEPENFESLVRAWVWLSLALNSLNRSMGLPDSYPFVLSKTSVEKLRFVHDLIRRAGRGTGGIEPTSAILPLEAVA